LIEGDIIPNTIMLKVIPVCQECGKPVATTKDDKAVRHGFKRFKRTMVSDRRRHSQEDGIPCSGSGKDIVYKRAKNISKK